jgi:LmbE family N-acetylglucosaminyl deacetylase
VASTTGPIRLVGVFAHPDDDVFSIGGTLVLHRSDVDPTLLFCTSGEHGPIWVEGLATRETLGAVREREQGAAMDALGIRSRSMFFRHQDGSLSDVPAEDLVEEISTVLRDVRPHLVVTFGADGLTSHPDHVRAGEATAEAFERVRGDAGETPPQRLLQVAPRLRPGRVHPAARRGGRRRPRRLPPEPRLGAGRADLGRGGYTPGRGSETGGRRGPSDPGRGARDDPRGGSLALLRHGMVRSGVAAEGRYRAGR